MTPRSPNSLPGQDTQPWYRQFWPWFLIALPASVVVAALTTVYIANRGSDDLVVDEYYKDGLAINRQLEKKQRATQMGITASVHVRARSVEVRTSGPVTAQQLHLLLSHPLEADRDFEIALQPTGSGAFRGELPNPVAARWHWTLEDRGAAPWRLDGTLGSDDVGD